MVLVTGGTGFIGSRLVDYLQASGQGVSVLSSGKTVSNAKTIRCNLGYEALPGNILQDVETVYHLAAVAEDKHYSQTSAGQVFAVNTRSTIELASRAADAGVNSFVFVSSVKAGHVHAAGFGSGESTQFTAASVYAKSKRDAELALLALSKKTVMKISIVRPAVVYGPAFKGNLRSMFDAVEKGWFPPPPETGNRRSLIHVDDLVKALVLVAQDPRTANEIYIASDGRFYSTRQIYEAMCHAAGKKTPVWHVPLSFLEFVSRFNKGFRLKMEKLLGNDCYSNEKLQQLGFTPQKTIFDRQSWGASS